MKKRIKREEQVLLYLLRRSVGKKSKKEMKKLPADVDWERLLALAREHAVLSLLYDVAEQSDCLPKELWQPFRRDCQVVAVSSYRLLFLTSWLTNCLANHGIIAITLKGIATASWYPVPELRKSGDVDLLLPNEGDYLRASRLLQKRGFRLEEEQLAQHHIVLKNQEGISVELHGMLAEPFESRRINKYLEQLMTEYSTYWEINSYWGLEVFQPQKAYHAFYLVLHMLQHFLRAGFGLKYLCDWVVFWNKGVPQEERDVFLKLCAESGTLGFVRIMTAVCVRYLGLDAACAPVEVPEWRLCASGGECSKKKRQQAAQNNYRMKQFMWDIFDAGEFGHRSGGRMVAMRGTGLWSYVTEFHHQMHLNFPVLGKIPVLWPVLWMATLALFVRNNHNIRAVSSREIIKKAHKRSRMVKQMRLFRTALGKR